MWDRPLAAFALVAMTTRISEVPMQTPSKRPTTQSAAPLLRSPCASGIAVAVKIAVKTDLGSTFPMPTRSSAPLSTRADARRRAAHRSSMLVHRDAPGDEARPGGSHQGERNQKRPRVVEPVAGAREQRKQPAGDHRSEERRPHRAAARGPTASDPPDPHRINMHSSRQPCNRATASFLASLRGRHGRHPAEGGNPPRRDQVISGKRLDRRS